MPLEHRQHARCGCASIGSAEHASAARPFALPSSTRHFERDRPFAIDHLALDIALDVRARSVRATAALDVRRVDPSATELELDAIGFEIHEVILDGEPASFQYDGRVLCLSHPGDAVAGPRRRSRTARRRGAASTSSRRTSTSPTGPRQVWTQCQDEDARHFFPCHDKPHVKMTTEIASRVPAGWYALSNGELVASERPAEGDGVFHWKMDEPHPSYLVTLVAGEFAELDRRREGGDARGAAHVPRPEGPRGGRHAHLRAHAGDDRALRRAHRRRRTRGTSTRRSSSATSSSAGWRTPPRRRCTSTSCSTSAPRSTSRRDDLIAHELAHQWFGDYVTCRDWSRRLAQRGLRDVHGARLAREAPRARRVRLRRQGRPRRVPRRGARPLPARRSSARTTTRRSTSSIGTSTRRAASSCTCSARELGDALFWRGVRVYLTRHARGRRRDARSACARSRR